MAKTTTTTMMMMKNINQNEIYSTTFNEITIEMSFVYNTHIMERNRNKIFVFIEGIRHIIRMCYLNHCGIVMFCLFISYKWTDTNCARHILTRRSWWWWWWWWHRAHAVKFEKKWKKKQQHKKQHQQKKQQ